QSSVPAAAFPSAEPAAQPLARFGESPALISSETTHTLRVLRDFSGILTHSLDAEATLKQFLLLLREILSINRAAIFLRPAFTTNGAPMAQPEGRQLRAASAIGVSPGLLQHFELSFETGIGGHL